MTQTCEFVWYELLSPDAGAARAFYSKVVGCKTVETGMDTG
jgi:predicted enzyme related to lactoylglutathione lyase